MNILIIRANPVNPDSRVEKEAYALHNGGHNVTILGWDRDANYRLKREALFIHSKKIDIYRFGVKAKYGTGIKNIFKLLRFQLVIFVFIKRNLFDVVHACDFDTAFAAYCSINKTKTKFVYDIFDYYTDAFRIPFVIKRLVSKADQRIIHKANAVIICTEERKKQISGDLLHNLIVIHNTPQCLQVFQETITSNNEHKIKICYVGILQPGRLLVELSEIVLSHPEYELHIGGFGIFEDYFKDLSKKNSNIVFYGKVSYDFALSLENNCDIMLALYDPSCINHVYAAPNKFYEALMLGKPLIMVRNTGMSKIIEENDLGEIINYSKDGLEEGIYRLIQKKEYWDHIRNKAKRIYHERFSWEIMEKRLLDMYDSIS